MIFLETTTVSFLLSVSGARSSANRATSMHIFSTLRPSSMSCVWTPVCSFWCASSSAAKRASLMAAAAGAIFILPAINVTPVASTFDACLNAFTDVLLRLPDISATLATTAACRSTSAHTSAELSVHLLRQVRLVPGKSTKLPLLRTWRPDAAEGLLVF